MAVDYLIIFSASAVLFSSVIVVFACYRAIEFGHVLVGSIYKRRANWAAIFLASTMFLTLDGTGSVPYLSWDNAYLGFWVITVTLPLFINSSVRAAQETDFFHRDTLHWRILGRVITVIAICSVILSVVVGITAPGGFAATLENSGASSSWWVPVGLGLFFLVLIVVSIYGSASLIVAARRTQDRAIRRFVLMLGLSLVGLVFFLTVWLPIDDVAPGVGDAISYLGFIIEAYYLYKAVMSLSPLGKMEKLEGTSGAAGLQVT